MSSSYLVGLDLGQLRDFSALSVLERTERYPAGTLFPEVTKREVHYAVRYIKRWPLSTSYPAIVEDIKGLIARPPLPGCRFVVDAAGVGRAIFDLLKAAV